MSIVRRFADLEPVPWRNGRGVTREVVAEPAGAAWAWRVSMAEVAGDDDFSVFPDVDRTIIVVAGGGMALTVDGVETVLAEPFVPFAFDGDATTACRLLVGPLRDLNLMVRRGAARATPDVVALRAGAAHGVLGAGALVVLDGTLRAGADVLVACDAVVLAEGDALAAVAGRAGATLAVVAVS